VIAVWAASDELGPFVEYSPTDSALSLQLYITLAALTTLCLRRSSAIGDAPGWN
jgi:hypothetical protein